MDEVFKALADPTRRKLLDHEEPVARMGRCLPDRSLHHAGEPFRSTHQTLGFHER